MRDFLDKLLPLALIGVLIYCIFSFFSNLQQSQDIRFKNWSNLCRDNGGIVQLVSTSQAECFKGSKIILHIE